MTLSIPFISQNDVFTDPDRKMRGCSIACLLMILRFLNPSDTLTPDGLFDEGLAIGGVDADKNWTHAAIVRLARNHGVHAYGEEFRSLTEGKPNARERRFIEDGVAKIRAELDRGFPIMVSVPGRRIGGPHSVVIIGYEIEKEGVGFWYHNPDADRPADGERQYMKPDLFAKNWRTLAIFFWT